MGVFCHWGCSASQLHSPHGRLRFFFMGVKYFVSEFVFTFILCVSVHFCFSHFCDYDYNSELRPYFSCLQLKQSVLLFYIFVIGKI